MRISHDYKIRERVVRFVETHEQGVYRSENQKRLLTAYPSTNFFVLWMIAMLCQLGKDLIEHVSLLFDRAFLFAMCKEIGLSFACIHEPFRASATRTIKSLNLISRTTTTS